VLELHHTKQVVVVGLGQRVLQEVVLVMVVLVALD
jgi:hypothetical protein